MATSAEDPNRDEDRLPWLETVEEDYHERLPLGRIVMLILICIGAVAAAVVAYRNYQEHKTVSGGGNGAMINAQEGDYKVKPDEPGGMKVAGEGDAALATSAGQAPGNASIDLKAVPEAPVTGTKAPVAKPQAEGKAVAVPASGGQLKVAAPAKVVTPVSSGAAGGAVVQLGSFPSESGANAAWAGASKRFAYLAPLGKSVQKAEVNGHTVYRLRVNAGSAGQASELCGKLKVAGEACFVARD